MSMVRSKQRSGKHCRMNVETKRRGKFSLGTEIAYEQDPTPREAKSAAQLEGGRAFPDPARGQERTVPERQSLTSEVPSDVVWKARGRLDGGCPSSERSRVALLLWTRIQLASISVRSQPWHPRPLFAFRAAEPNNHLSGTKPEHARPSVALIASRPSLPTSHQRNIEIR